MAIVLHQSKVDRASRNVSHDGAAEQRFTCQKKPQAEMAGNTPRS